MLRDPQMRQGAAEEVTDTWADWVEVQSFGAAFGEGRDEGNEGSRSEAGAGKGALRPH